MEQQIISLSSYRLIEIAGLDAEKYLQGQLTGDVAKIAVGEQTLTCHCDPKGKMSALFRLYRHTPEQFFAVIHQSLLPEALVQLKKYAVFSKVVFSERADQLFGVLNASGDFMANFGKDLTAFSLPDGRLIAWGAELSTTSDENQWELADIEQGIPALRKANQFELIPQATNLQMLEQAISFTKGCYIGQETVARAKYRGANKRAMFTFVGDYQGQILPEISGAIEMQIGENWKSTGTILQVLPVEQKLWLQAVLNRDLEEDSQFRAGDIMLKIVPLPYEVTA